jgi:transposase-like protein
LTPVQEQVLAAIAAGVTISDAAAKAGVHRNSVGYWRRTNAKFKIALQHAHYDFALLVHEEAVALAGRALATIKEILDDPKASPSVRLKAALAILKQASSMPPEPPLNLNFFTHNDAQTHSDAQTPASDGPWTVPLNPPDARSLHKDAQSPT